MSCTRDGRWSMIVYIDHIGWPSGRVWIEPAAWSIDFWRKKTLLQTIQDRSKFTL